MMNLTKIPLLLCFCFILCFNLTAQEYSKNVNTSSSKGLTELRIGVNLENAIHPGLKLGTSYFLKEKTKVRKHKLNFRQDKHGDKVKVIQYLADANIGFYNHRYNHLGTFVGIGFTRLRTKVQKMKTLAWSFEVNYLRRFYNLKTYELNEDGTVETLKGAGTNSLLFAIAPSWRKGFGTRGEEKAWYLYLKPSLQMLKYNHAFFPNATLEIGVNLNLK